MNHGCLRDILDMETAEAYSGLQLAVLPNTNMLCCTTETHP